MAPTVIMPQFGTSVEEVVLLKWCKKEGDPVARGDVICEIETDKASTDLEAFAEGILLQQVVVAGSRVKTGEVIAYIG